jgi:hypothetical protein
MKKAKAYAECDFGIDSGDDCSVVVDDCSDSFFCYIE